MSTPAVRSQVSSMPHLPIGAGSDRGEAMQLRNVGRNVALFTAAYLLDVAGMLDDGARGRLDRLDPGGYRPWNQAVESIYRLDRAFLQNLYAVLLDSFLPHDALAFILRGLDVPRPVELLGFVLSLNDE